jgi:uncharacterized protein YjbI with pentapeptide repeats
MSLMSWLAVVAAAVALLVVAFIVAAYVRRWEWAGFAAAGPERPLKTVWDWLQLLVIPLGLAVVAFALNAAQSSREQRREDRRAELDRQIAADRRREDALSAYLQQMSDLMLVRKLRRAQPGSEVGTLARTLTLSVLQRLDGRRKVVVLQFLGEAGLIKPPDGHEIVDLSDADFHGVVVRRALLTDLDLDEADLRGAIFRSMRLDNVSMRKARLEHASFTSVDALEVNFTEARLVHASFNRARIIDSDFIQACITGTRFTYSTIASTPLQFAVGRDIDLVHTVLDDVDLRITALENIRLDHVTLANGGHGPLASNRVGKHLEPAC